MFLSTITGANGKSWEDIPEMVWISRNCRMSQAWQILAGVVQFVYKNELLNIPSLGIDPSFDKAEGLALKEDGTLVVTFDNDFVHDEDRDTDNMLRRDHVQRSPGRYRKTMKAVKRM